jgi:hypothetical protein
MTGNADEIAQIEQLEQFERPGAYDIKFHVNLQTLAGSGNMRKTSFAVQAKREDASGHAHGRFGSFERRGINRRIFFDELRRGFCPIEPVGVCVMAASLDLGKFLLALEILVVRLKR